MFFLTLICPKIFIFQLFNFPQVSFNALQFLHNSKPLLSHWIAIPLSGPNVLQEIQINKPHIHKLNGVRPQPKWSNPITVGKWLETRNGSTSWTKFVNSSGGEITNSYVYYPAVLGNLSNKSGVLEGWQWW